MIAFGSEKCDTGHSVWSSQMSINIYFSTFVDFMPVIQSEIILVRKIRHFWQD